MSKADDAPIIFERMDMDTASGIAVSIIVGGERWRNAIFIRDNASPEIIAIKLHSLANWIERKMKTVMAESNGA